MKIFKISGSPIGGMIAIKSEATTTDELISDLYAQKNISLDFEEVSVTVNGINVQKGDTLPAASAYIVEVSEKNPDSGIQ